MPGQLSPASPSHLLVFPASGEVQKHVFLLCFTSWFLNFKNPNWANSPQPLSFDQDWSEEHKLGENTSSSTISVRRWSLYKNITNLCFVHIAIIICHKGLVDLIHIGRLTFSSHLRVSVAHSGIYECRPSNSPPANVSLLVLEGDKTRPSKQCKSLIWIMILGFYVLICYRICRAEQLSRGTLLQRILSQGTLIYDGTGSI